MWRINSVEEITTTTTEAYSDEDEDHFPQLSLNLSHTPIKVAFPEAGIDIIDVNVNGYDLKEDLLLERAVKWTDLQHWQENWLFKKRKRSDNKSDIMLGYMAMILTQLPVSMLIPNPNPRVRASVGGKEVDELSELSEHNSVGSLDFSDDESECESDVQNGNELSAKGLSNERSDGYIATQIMAIISETDNKETKELKVMTKVVDNKNKSNIKLSEKAPDFVPKVLRTNDLSGDSDPHFVLKPGDACVQSGITVQFCCRAKGTKPLLFSWFKNETILKCDSNYRIFQSGEENVLEIKRTSVDNTAQYSCVVYNRLSYQWCDFDFQVKPNSTFAINKMPINRQENALKLPIVSESEPKVSKTTTNPKHEIHEKQPLVVQRTWADRVAELRYNNCNLKAQNQNTDLNGVNTSSAVNEADIGLSSVPVLMSATIADREHRKWEIPDIEWKDNPYSVENLNLRIQERALILSLGIESLDELPEESNGAEEVESLVLSSNSKDLNRYKKDYYVKQSLDKEETLRSFEENEYFGRKQMMRQSSEDMSQISEFSIDKNWNETESELIVSDSDTVLPSVKDLVNRFSWSDEPNDSIPKLVDIKRKNSFCDNKLNNLSKNAIQTSQPNFKVHSLTARSLTKEFREMSRLNIPRTQRNRIGITGQHNAIHPIESESSSPSTPCSPTNEGYASDESNSSSTGVRSRNGNRKDSAGVDRNKLRSGRKVSRSILSRANYWQKRCEHGLISDSSVNEDFPPMETIANH